MRCSVLSVTVLAALQFSFTLASRNGPDFYPLEAREIGEFEMLGREMIKNGVQKGGFDITADLERRAMSLNPRQSCSAGRAVRAEVRAGRPGSAAGTGAPRTMQPVARLMATFVGLDTCAAERDTAFFQEVNAAGTGCRAGSSGGGGSSVAADPTSAGSRVSEAPMPTSPPQSGNRGQLEYTWYTTRITWYYYYYYYVWISTIDVTSTRTSTITTTTTVSVFVTDSAAATSSFRAMAVVLSSSTPVQSSTEFEGPTPEPSPSTSSRLESTPIRSAETPDPTTATDNDAQPASGGANGGASVYIL
ncbi:hypothetical protein DRE_06668 [Drechslerella stenobrocha 248]|uniref:Uncharacterized protein n=1 Tax=Drechslerella stenobrocha 248 TaxID=1043628 RepID=W7HWY2_9PEZI|nr:hypothetical protein DRE_06668 [Drechslerella stenobrocha 248]